LVMWAKLSKVEFHEVEMGKWGKGTMLSLFSTSLSVKNQMPRVCVTTKKVYGFYKSFPTRSASSSEG